MEKLLVIVLSAIPIIFAITVHEVAHGWVANKLGDPTAKIMGRLTLNPLKHIDPIGTIILPGILLLLGSKFIFGWAKPVPVSWANLKNKRRDFALVAAAGPGVNFLMAILWACLLKLSTLLATPDGFVDHAMAIMCGVGVLSNLVLMILNLIPIPPLDGSRVVASFLPPRLADYYNKIEPYGFYILIALLFTGVLSKLMTPALLFMLTFIRTLFGI